MSGKYYVVWEGRVPGVYDNWDDAREQVENYEGARFKGFGSAADAAEAYRRGSPEADTASLSRLVTSGRPAPGPGRADYSAFPEIDLTAWAVDASCQGNPGIMEYQGVEVATGRVIFRIGPFRDATNNIGEFLAIVHAMALMAREGDYRNIYSDSVSGMAWVRRRMVKTTLAPTEHNRKVFELMARALAWLRTHTFPCRVMKWQTELWGEIPADFGRK